MMMKLEKNIVVSLARGMAVMALFFALISLSACGDDGSTSKPEESGSVIGPDGKVIPDSILASDSLYTWYLDMLAKGIDPLSPNSSAASPIPLRISAAWSPWRWRRSCFP